MQLSRFRRSLLSFAPCLSLVCLALAGCSANVIPVPVVPAIAVSGNWQIASSDAAAARLPLLSGELSGSSAAMQGIVHSHAVADCVAPTTPIALTGSADSHNRVTLTGANLAGGTLTLTGTLAADGKSLTSAAYIVTGGSCAFTAQVSAVAQAFSPIAGTFTGNFSDPQGQVVSITATLMQNPTFDANGDFTLSGSATFANPCFSNSVNIASSTVTGGNFNLTYTDPATMNSVTADGTFSTDGGTLNVNTWSLTGPCGPDSGTGLLTRH